ncbi:MAG: polysulfide reductase NrfD [Actinobacteria bacterium]|nr:polysulfide reductase NrfD [Actinomycetota bacterium]MCL5446630.1 polysulfide reductase NrfD [Actinomycetota bacterium]
MGGSLTHSGLENAYWGVMVVTYPFISGLVAGSFVVSSLSHVFRQRKFDALAPLAVLTSLALLIAAPLTVLGDARQPSNVLELLTRDHFPYSPLATFILIWLTYIALMLVELYFAFRATNVRIGMGEGWWAKLHRALALGSRDASESRARRDRKVLVWLSAAGIALAFLFHGYIGFVFGATKARALWATPLMPVLFIVSAMVSGIALMWLIYVVALRYIGRKPDRQLADGLLVYLMLFILLDLFLDAVDLVTSAVPQYAQGATYYGFYHLMLNGPFSLTYLGIQLGVGMVLPLVLWLVPVVRRSWLGGVVISLAVLAGVYAMRWNVVLGGQAESKISSNTVVTTSVPLTGFDSLQTVLGVFAVALLLFLLLTWLFPWRDAGEIYPVPDEIYPGSEPSPAIGDQPVAMASPASGTSMSMSMQGNPVAGVQIDGGDV